jgi:hypothetical protein
MAKLKGMAPSLEETAAQAPSSTDSMRMRALADLLKHLTSKA